MAKLNVNPTRMEMTRLKRQLKTATRGHKLLKDKLDELMKQFLEIVRENKRLREQAEAALESAYQNFIIARAVMSESTLAEALMIPQQSVAVKVKNRNIMSVNVPVFDFQKEEGSGDIYPYGTAFTSGELDSAMNSFSDAMEPLLRLAESEKTAQLLAQEIERTRRRVNALENVMIPNYQETIKFIAMKLEENGKIIYQGEISLTFIYGQEGTTRINIKNLVEPFEFTVTSNSIAQKMRIDTSIEIAKKDFVVMADSTIDIKVDLNFRLNIVKESSINLIESVTESEKKDRESFSIIVYYARVGDTLWKIAKKFGSTVDEIVKVNGIENPDVIMPGEQLFIPR